MKDDNLKRLRATRVYLAEEARDLEAFRALVERTVDPADYPVSQQQFEESLPVDAVQFRRAALQVANYCVFVRIAEGRERAAFLLPAILVERRQRLAVLHGWTVLRWIVPCSSPG
jgi:hypothetical protein